MDIDPHSSRDTFDASENGQSMLIDMSRTWNLICPEVLVGFPEIKCDLCTVDECKVVTLQEDFAVSWQGLTLGAQIPMR